MNDFGERLKEERLRLGYGVEEFAKIGGCGRTTQFKYEKGQSSPDIPYLEKVGVVGVDVIYVVTGQRPSEAVYASPLEAMQAVVDVQEELRLKFDAGQIKNLVGMAYQYQLSPDKLKGVIRDSYKFHGANIEDHTQE